MRKIFSLFMLLAFCLGSCLLNRRWTTMQWPEW